MRDKSAAIQLDERKIIYKIASQEAAKNKMAEVKQPLLSRCLGSSVKAYKPQPGSHHV
jgi:hypothetical protein